MKRKKSTIISFTLDPNNPPKGEGMDFAKLDAMTDEEINAAAMSDPDCPPSTPEELKRFERVVDVKSLRKKLHMTQEQFADDFHLSLSVVKDWEQMRYMPDQAARNLLKVIAHNPEAVKMALEKRF